LEIGAGTGALTQALLGVAPEVTALEIDSDLVGLLRTLPALAAAHIIQADALTFDYAAFGGRRPWLVTGNLPYNIATPLLLRLIEMESGPEQLVVMIQKDVAQRLAARPATPAYGSLTLTVQYAMQVERLFSLGPQAFYPRPKVESTIVRLVRRSEPPVRARNAQFLLQVTRAAFAYRRKTLANSLRLALHVEPAHTAAALRSIGLRPEVRGEELDLAQFAAVADALDR
jgi:16S rRNA (adenine1518-N6/adenine1519-N6)-dimethyltransferase